jgi:hypothetical protein
VKTITKKLTVDDVIEYAGGVENIVKIGIATRNKYFKDPRPVIKEQLDWAHYLELDKLPSSNILDIGTGAGFFHVICNMYQHNAMSCDERGRLGWDPCYKFLKIEPVHYLVQKYQSVGSTFDRKFDLVVSFRSFIGTSFRWLPPNDDVWGLPEWKFFLNDTSKHLLKDSTSRIFLACNRADKLPPYAALPDSEKTIWGSFELGSFFEPYYIKQNSELGLHGNIFTMTKSQIDEIK